MKIGLYIVSSILFIIAVAVATYLINPGSYSFDILDIHLPKIPVAVWVALPVALLAIFSVIHMAFYGAKVFFANKKWRSDANKLEEGIYWSLIKEPTTITYYHPEIEKSASLLSFSTIEPKEEQSEQSSRLSSKLKDVLNVIYKIRKGEYVDLKKEKFAKHLSPDNEIVIENEINRLNHDPKYALKILDFKDRYDERVINLALDKLVETQDFYTIKKYGKEIGKERFFKLLQRVEKGEDIGFSKDMLRSFLEFYTL
ncbi:MAG: hypothetical protein GXN91_04995, partial [Epsilonproteobacteria bacterium]|nr:hypothetical protein [Campylobacterota bacterium]